jgi:hypothetical protein
MIRHNFSESVTWMINAPTGRLKATRPVIRLITSSARLLVAGAVNTDCYVGDGRELSCCRASAFEWAVALTAAQERPDKLPRALVAMDTIAAVEAHGE